MIEYLKQRLKFLKKTMKSAETYLKNCPPECLFLKKRGNSVELYCKYKNKSKYISKRNITLAKKLAQKKYAKTVIKETEKQIEVLELFLQNYKPDFLIDICNEMHPKVSELIEKYELTDDEYAEKWMSQKTVNNSYSFANNNLFSAKGEKMRSKSEVIIADRMKELGIPYLYESGLQINYHEWIFPDFTVLNKRTRKVYYFEHFGRMDDEEYRRLNFYNKLNKYSKIGINIGDSLICTFEEKDNSIDLLVLDKILKSNFL